MSTYLSCFLFGSGYVRAGHGGDVEAGPQACDLGCLFLELLGVGRGQGPPLVLVASQPVPKKKMKNNNNGA